MDIVITITAVVITIFLGRNHIYRYLYNLYWGALDGMATYVNHPRYTQVVNHLYKSLHEGDVQAMTDSISEAFHLLSGSIKYTPITCIEDKEDNCPICMERALRGQKIVILPCGHFGHYTCMREWLLNNTECPICKGEC